jgi:Animal haem peroxidase
MESDVTRMPDKPGPPPPPKVAYTYFGQFIVHDLTRDDTPLFQNPLPEPDAVLNHRTPFLDLDSLYGRGPFSEDSDLYEADGASLKVGIVKTEHGQTFDVPLDPSTSQPLLADDRNNENIIIRQIHAIFLKLHNMAVAELRGSVRVPPRGSGTAWCVTPTILIALNWSFRSERFSRKPTNLKSSILHLQSIGGDLHATPHIQLTQRS